MADKSVNTFNVSNVSEFNSSDIGKIDVVNIKDGDCIIMSYIDNNNLTNQDIETLTKVKEKLKQTFPNNTVITKPNWINLSVVKRD